MDKANSIKFDSTLIFQDEKNSCVKLKNFETTVDSEYSNSNLEGKLKRVGVIASKELTEEQTLKIQALKLNVRTLNK